MRFNRKQLDEATTKAHDRGYKDGRKVMKRSMFFVFVLGLVFGAVGFLCYLEYGAEINNYVKTLIQSA